MLVMIRSTVSKGSTLVVSLLMIGTIFASGIGFEDQKVISEEGIISYTGDSSNWTINPSSGPSDGGTNLTITGSGFSSLFDNITFPEEIVRSWIDTTVDTGGGGDVGQHSSMAIDLSGNIHISYYDNTWPGGGKDLKYATYDGSNWIISLVDLTGDLGMYTSLAVDSSGDVHISYYDVDNKDLKYATYDGSSWTISTVDSTGDVGQYTSIAIDSNDDLHISYLDNTNADLKYATYDGSSWTISIVDSASYVGKYTSIAIDSNDNIHISYHHFTYFDLKYATYDGSSWTVETVDNTGSVGYWTSIAIDSNDNMHISYRDRSNNDLKYATNNGNSWTISTVDSAGDLGAYTSLAVDSSGDVHISYYDERTGPGDGDLKYATYDGNSWTNTTIDSTDDVGEFTSLVVDSSGDVHISYYDVTNGDLKYTKLSSNPVIIEEPIAHWNFDEIGPRYWTTSTLSSTEDGTYNSLVVDSNDEIHISYFNETINNLYYAHFDGNSWSHSLVDGGGSSYVNGQYNSIAIDSNDEIYISYYDGNEQDLKYAYLDGSTWLTSSIDTMGDVGKYSSIVIDSSNDIHISYYDETNDDLKYALGVGSGVSITWSISTVDSVGDVGDYSSIAVNSSNNAHITYLDVSNENLKYAYYNGNSWINSTINSGGRVAHQTSITIDSSDNIHVSYFDNQNNNLNYAYFGGSSWTTRTIDTGGGTGSSTAVGFHSSIAVETNGRAYISYQDITNSDLKYAFYDGNQWSSTTVESNGFVGAHTSIGIDSNEEIHISYQDGSNNVLKYAKTSRDYLSDSSGNGHDGTCLTTTCPTWHPSYGRMWTGAMSFDGIDDNVDLNFRFSSLPPTGFSTCMWVKNDRSTFSNANVIWGTDGGDEWKIVLPTDGSIQTYIRASGGDAVASVDNFSVRIGGNFWWHHVCSVYDVNLGELQLYIDGTIGNTAYVNLTGFNQGVNQFLGCMGKVSSQTCRTDSDNFKGKIEDVRIYDHALSPSEIQDYYIANTEPWGHYTLDEITFGNHVLDSSEGAYRMAGNVFGTPTEVPGKIGTALNFDGIGDNDSIDLGNDAIERIIQYGAMTFSTWVNVEPGITGDPYIASLGRGNSNLGSLIGLTIAPNGTVRFFTPSTSISYPMIWSTTSIDDGTWHQVTATLEVTNNVVGIKL